MTIIVEYRNKGRLDHPFSLSRRDVSGLTRELKILAGQVKSAGIDMEFKITSIAENEPNDILINGKSISKILDGLNIVLEGGCSNCSVSCDESSCASAEKAERAELDWNRTVMEDIPEALLKNALSKAIADSR